MMLIEQLFMCLFSIYRSSLVNCLFKSLPHFLKIQLCSQYLVVKVFLYIWDVSSLIRLYFVNNVSQSVACIFIFLMRSFKITLLRYH